MIPKLTILQLDHTVWQIVQYQLIAFQRLLLYKEGRQRQSALTAAVELPKDHKQVFAQGLLEWRRFAAHDLRGKMTNAKENAGHGE